MRLLSLGGGGGRKSSFLEQLWSQLGYSSHDPARRGLQSYFCTLMFIQLVMCTYMCIYIVIYFLILCMLYTHIISIYPLIPHAHTNTHTQTYIHIFSEVNSNSLPGALFFLLPEHLKASYQLCFIVKMLLT
jgi:hypothetical protein